MNTMELPDNVIGTMFKILKAAMAFANLLVENLTRTPSEIFSNWLADINTPDWLNTIITGWLNINNPFISNLTIFDILLGGALMIVLIIGVVKFFGDALGL